MLCTKNYFSLLSTKCKEKSDFDWIVTWFDISNVPANHKIDNTIQGHHHQAPMEAHFISLYGTVSDVFPADPNHLDLVASQVLRSESKGSGRG